MTILNILFINMSILIHVSMAIVEDMIDSIKEIRYELDKALADQITRLMKVSCRQVTTIFNILEIW